MAEPGLLSVRFFAKLVGSRMDCAARVILGNAPRWGVLDWSFIRSQCSWQRIQTKQVLCPLTDIAAG